MEDLPLEVACHVLERITNPYEIARWYNASTTTRAQVEACTRFLEMEEFTVLPLPVAHFLLGLPRLVTARNIAFGVEKTLDLLHLSAISPLLREVRFFVAKAAFLPLLIQRIIDVVGIRSFVSRSWLFLFPVGRTRPTNLVFWLLVENSAILEGTQTILRRERGSETEIVDASHAGFSVTREVLRDVGFTAMTPESPFRRSYLAYADIGEEGIGTSTPLLSDILTTGTLPNADPTRPSGSDNPLLKDLLVLTPLGMAGPGYLRAMVLAIFVEAGLNPSGPNLARWARRFKVMHDSLERMDREYAANPAYYVALGNLPYAAEVAMDIAVPAPLDRDAEMVATQSLETIRGSFRQAVNIEGPMYFGSYAYTMPAKREVADRISSLGFPFFVRETIYALRGL